MKNNEYRFGGNRNKALERDGFICVKCGMTQEQHIEKFKCSLSVDHIDNMGRYSDTPNHNLSNLQTLCLPCHGRKDNPPSQNETTSKKCTSCLLIKPIDSFSKRATATRHNMCKPCFYVKYQIKSKQ